jgi:hypothetical protein
MTDPTAPVPSHPSAEEGPRVPGSPPAGAPVPPPAPRVAPHSVAAVPVLTTPAVVPWSQTVYAAPPPKGLSITSMVLGLVSLVLFWTVACPIVGLVLGIVGVRTEPAGRGFAITGLVLNGLLLLIPVAVILFLLAAGTTVAGVAATSGR